MRAHLIASAFALGLFQLAHAQQVAPPSPVRPNGLLFPRSMRSTLIPAIHLAKLNASSTPTVCATGDSTMATAGIVQGPVANLPGVTPIDRLYNMLQQRILEDNPNKTISFQNFAIGSQTWTSQDNVATSNLPAFYFNSSLPWLPYIQAANCTSLFINFGVNDADGIIGTSVRSVLNKIVAWGNTQPAWSTSTAYAKGAVIQDSNAKLEIAATAGTSGSGSHPTWATTQGASTTDGTVTWQLLSASAYVAAVPDIILITNKNTNAAAGAPYNTVLNQNGTLNAASFQRNIALSRAPGFAITGLPPIGLIDIGRYFTEAFNGFDPVEQYLTTVITSAVSVSSFPYSLPATAGDFDLNISIPNGSGFGGGSNYIGIATGAPGSSAGSMFYIGSNSTTCYVFASDSSGQAGYAFALANDWNAGSNTVEIVARGERIYATCNGQLIMDKLQARYSGPFTPSISLINPPASPAITINYYSSGSNRLYTPTVGATLCFGTAFGANGGNGINHDSSVCENAVDWAVLENTRFSP